MITLIEIISVKDKSPYNFLYRRSSRTRVCFVCVCWEMNLQAHALCPRLSSRSHQRSSRFLTVNELASGLAEWRPKSRHVIFFFCSRWWWFFLYRKYVAFVLITVATLFGSSVYKLFLAILLSIMNWRWSHYLWSVCVHSTILVNSVGITLNAQNL